MPIRRVLLGLAVLAGCGKGAAVVDAGAEYTVTTTRLGNGTGTITSTPAGIDCGGDCSESFAAGTEVTLHAAAAGDSSFVGWSGGGCSGTGDCTVRVADDLTVAAQFALKNSVVVTLAGNGTGTVASSPAGIYCPTDCSEAYSPTQTVTLTATAGSSSTFSGWSGGCTGAAPSCTVSTDAAVGVVATFALQQYTLTVAKAGTGSGTVTSSPAGITCGGTCSASYDSGSTVTLTAAATVGSTFTGWSGAGCSGTGTCSVPISAATTVTATFTLDQYLLTVSLGGNGSGTVTSSPAGISCGTTCSAAFNYGQTVTLTAAAAVGSTFSGWSGGGCAGTGTCDVPISAAASVTATFTLDQYLLTVSLAGNGSGTVTSSPAGISCGATCSATFTYGQTVTLTASASAGSTFIGWSGSCTGTGTCAVSMTAVMSATATFTTGGLTCTSVANAVSCTNGTIAELNLGAITATACRSQCQAAMPGAGMTTGCWILASNLNCYCRSGNLNLGGTRPGGVCN